MRSAPRGWAWTLLLVLAGLAGTLGVRAPSASSAPEAEEVLPDTFSLARARQHVEVVALDPHPSSSAPNQLVLEYLQDELERLGFQPEIQVGTVDDEGVRAGPPDGTITNTNYLENLLVRLPARGAGDDAAGASSGTIVFACHYDGHGAAPGAGDDAAAVAAFLEALRVLSLDPPLRNELLFLFTDGEELGLLGAKLFTARHPAMADIDLVFNFEGRGNAGPAILFETGRNNGWVMREAAQCLPTPVASSLGPTIYSLMRNDTDFTEFNKRGLPGLNFAWLGGASAYHSVFDTPENLDPDSLLHHGENVLALARHFGELELVDMQAERDTAFFTLPGNLLVLYGGRWNLPLGALAIALALIAVTRAFLRERLSARGLGVGTALAVVLVGAVAAATWWTAEYVGGLPGTWFAERLAGEPRGDWISSRVTFHGIGALAAGLWALVLGRASARLRDALVAGALVVWTALTALLLVKLEGASTTVVWPLGFGALAAFASWGRARGTEAANTSAAGFTASATIATCSAAVLALLCPTLSMNHLTWATDPPLAASYSAVLAALTAALLSPALVRAGRWRWLFVFAGLALLAAGGALGVAGR